MHSTTSYDVELPIECDDEYWDHPDPSLAFQQPAGKPSTIAYFNCYLKLMDIFAYAMRVVVSPLFLYTMDYKFTYITPVFGQETLKVFWRQNTISRPTNYNRP